MEKREAEAKSFDFRLRDSVFFHWVTLKNGHHISDVAAVKGTRGGRGEGVPGGSRKLNLEASCVNAGESEPE